MRSELGLVIKRNRLLVFLEVSVLVKSVGDQQVNLTFKKSQDVILKGKLYKVKFQLIKIYSVYLRVTCTRCCFFFLRELQTFSFRSSTEVSRRGLKTSSTLPKASWKVSRDSVTSSGKSGSSSTWAAILKMRCAGGLGRSVWHRGFCNEAIFSIKWRRLKTCQTDPRCKSGVHKNYNPNYSALWNLKGIKWASC